MRLTLSKLLLLSCLTAQAGWMAYNPEGRTAAVVTASPGDVATVRMPDDSRNRNLGLAFLTNTDGPIGNQLGKVLSAVISMDGTGSPVWLNYSVNGVTVPVSVRLWFSSQATPYAATKVKESTQATYWWSNPLDIDLTALWLFGPVVLEESLATPGRWSSAWGKNGADPAYLPAFQSAASNIRQVGFSFGSYFFDTGAKCAAGTGTATFHVHSITVK
jgi:hypothetical protein